MAWAIVASVVVHAAVLIATLPGGAPGVPQPMVRALRASLVVVPAPEAVPSEQPPQAVPVLAALPERSPLKFPAPPSLRQFAAQPPAAAPRAGFGNVEVEAQVISDRARIGDHLSRQMTEFPIEMDRLPRIAERIVARYPPTAAAEGREESVVVWAIVDASGKVEEAYVTEGSEEFAAEALAAVRAARFVPAQNKLRVQPYSITLEFDFRASKATAARAK